MSHTAQTTLHQELAEANLRYFFLLKKLRKERRGGRFALGLEEQVIWSRNTIVELQAKLPKGGESIHAN